uniref:Uncharacterized protein n=1 Tax=Palpitomonas bilix TaxID=652834 RepID=A0A7S3DFE2_9EUKA|mmetsp:Transcript_35243/g.91547  ORF Transcript_35243/g.91547 Transcript_35243/m.91547 type:complete len:214 (+) Transcript_35243:919-1560(+)
MRYLDRKVLNMFTNWCVLGCGASNAEELAEAFLKCGPTYARIREDQGLYSALLSCAGFVLNEVRKDYKIEDMAEQNRVTVITANDLRFRFGRYLMKTAASRRLPFETEYNEYSDDVEALADTIGGGKREIEVLIDTTNSLISRIKERKIEDKEEIRRRMEMKHLEMLDIQVVSNKGKEYDQDKRETKDNERRKVSEQKQKDKDKRNARQNKRE